MGVASEGEQGGGEGWGNTTSNTSTQKIMDSDGIFANTSCPVKR